MSSSICAQALEESRSGLSEKAFEQVPSARSTSIAKPCCEPAGQAFRSTEMSVIVMGFPCQDLSVAGKREGLCGSQSSLIFDILGLLPRMSNTPGAGGCPNCGATSSGSDMPACRFECPPRSLEGVTIADESLLLPTPTASAYGSCRGGGAGRVGKWRMSLHSRGILHPEDWERMMGFPIGHTDVSKSEMP